MSVNPFGTRRTWHLLGNLGRAIDVSRTSRDQVEGYPRLSLNHRPSLTDVFKHPLGLGIEVAVDAAEFGRKTIAVAGLIGNPLITLKVEIVEVKRDNDITAEK